MGLTIQNIIDRNNLTLTNQEKGVFAEIAKKDFGEFLERVKEKHNGVQVNVNAYPEDLEFDILKAGGFKKKRRRIKRFTLNSR